MNIFNKLFKTRAPTNKTILNPYRFMFGSTTAGKTVTEQTSMQMTAVYSCVRVLAEAVAGLPLHFYQYREDGGKERAVDQPLYFLLHDEPNTEMTSFVFRETLMTHLLLWGNAYAQIIRNGKGEVVALYPLLPEKMAVNRDEHKAIYYLYSADSGQVRLSKADVLHIPGLGFDGLVGYSPIAMAKNAIGLAIATEEYGSKFFANGANPGGVLQHPGTLKDPKRIRESWNATFGGSSNAAKVAVLEEGMTYAPISIAPEQAQFLETRKFQIEEIARIFRVPLHMVGDLEHATFSNVEHLSLDFVKFSLQPWLNRIEQATNQALLTKEEKRDYYIKFNVDGLLRGDYASRMQGYSTGIQNGFLSPDDVRQLEDLNPIEGGAGSKYYFNGNMLPIEQAGAAYQNNKESEEENEDEEILEMAESDDSESNHTRRKPRTSVKT
ncbi:MAG: phage portal protein [Streptococcaceae bacterium]|jgi:HK97 family phage portal protein|nr:phage portal protein [Streptococcaceae bacterium]